MLVNGLQVYKMMETYALQPLNGSLHHHNFIVGGFLMIRLAMKLGVKWGQMKSSCM